MNDLSSIWLSVLDNLSSRGCNYLCNILRDFKIDSYDSESRTYTFKVSYFQSVWIDNNGGLEILKDAFVSVLGDSTINLKFEECGDSEEEKPAAWPEVPKKSSGKKPILKEDEKPSLPTSINPDNTFETFIEGQENELACAAAKSIVEELYDRQSSNPLFIYGPSGIGKTHLLHAIANAAYKKYAGVRILYVSGESFTNDYINSLAERKTNEFRDRYRTLNLLLVDDIQFIAGKEQTMEEFFHTFNTLCMRGCKIVLTCDREASAMVLDDRLISRFKQGITADIHPPREVVRAAILKDKAQRRNFSFFPNFKEAFDFITQKITRNVRNLEGALNTLINYVRFRKVNTLNQAQLEEVLGSFVSSDSTSSISIKTVQDEVAKFYKLEIGDLCGKSRTASIAYARQVAMFLCLELTKSTQTAVGQAFGGRDHGTVINARKKVRDTVETDAERRKELEKLRTLLRH
ncbi:MAG: chromosomal replication initiator protein DnaA [Opitutales bacterium]|nr:chromosomal replication initiator protein DnaA [Opitutales bacterium]